MMKPGIVQPLHIPIQRSGEVASHHFAHFVFPELCQSLVIPYQSPTGCKIAGQIASPIWALGAQGNQ